MHQIMKQHPLQGDIKEEVVTPGRLFIPRGYTTPYGN